MLLRGKVCGEKREKVGKMDGNRGHIQGRKARLGINMRRIKARWKVELVPGSAHLDQHFTRPKHAASFSRNLRSGPLRQ